MIIRLLKTRSQPLLLAFLLLLGSFCHSTPLSLKEISQSPTWLALLHYRHGEFSIKDPAFLLQEKHQATPLSVLKKTIQLLENGEFAACRFPARYIWLVAQGVVSEQYVLSTCTDYMDFLRHVPADEISLIFASENLSKPSSMMGHSMLSLAGKNSDHILVEHSVSFGVELPLNPYKLVKETIIKGKTGLFTVKPLTESLDRYRYQEKRNVWRYPLHISEKNIRLIQSHIWELKDIDIPYIFQSHNCATLLLDILDIASPKGLKRADWISPIDLVREIDARNLITEKQLIPSKQWKIHMISEFITKDKEREAIQALDNKDVKYLHDPLQQQLVSSLLEYRYQDDKFDVQDYQLIKEQMSDWSQVEMTIDGYRDPLKSAPDSHLSFGYKSFANNHWLTARFLPASHDFDDDNRNYFSESALRLSDLTVRLQTLTQDVQIDNWTLYNVSALNPYNSLTGGLSGSFEISFDRRFDDELKEHPGINLSGGIGFSTLIFDDIGVYGLANLGGFFREKTSKVYLFPEAGAWAYWVGNMKSRLSYTQEYSKEEAVINQFSLSHSIGVSGYGRILISSIIRSSKNKKETTLDASLRLYY